MTQPPTPFLLTIESGIFKTLIQEILANSLANLIDFKNYSGSINIEAVAKEININLNDCHEVSRLIVIGLAQDNCSRQDSLLSRILISRNHKLYDTCKNKK